MTEKKQSDNKLLKRIVLVVLCLMIAIILVGLIQQMFLAPVSVSGVSMMPTFASSGDKVYVRKKYSDISRGDIVVFYRPKNDNVKSKNPSNSISFADFFNSLPFINKYPISSKNEYSTDDYTCVIKRVIAVGGDTVEIRYVEDTVRVELVLNGKVQNEKYIYEVMQRKDGAKGVKEVAKLTVPKGSLFVLGDNRNNSYDSDDYGCIKESWLMGKVVLAKVGGKYKRTF